MNIYVNTVITGGNGLLRATCKKDTRTELLTTTIASSVFLSAHGGGPHRVACLTGAHFKALPFI